MFKVSITINKDPNGKEIKERTYEYNCYYWYLNEDELGLECDDSFEDRVYSRQQIVALSICPVK